MPFGLEPISSAIVFCRKKLTAKDATSSVAGSALRSGRKATRSVTNARIITAIRPQAMASTTDWVMKSSIV